MDSRMSKASQSTGFIPTRREETWDTTEPSEEDNDVLVEYSIDTVSDEDQDENEAEVPSKDTRNPKDNP